jgi:hypothetical protein
VAIRPVDVAEREQSGNDPVEALCRHVHGNAYGGDARRREPRAEDLSGGPYLRDRIADDRVEARGAFDADDGVHCAVLRGSCHCEVAVCDTRKGGMLFHHDGGARRPLARRRTTPVLARRPDAGMLGVPNALQDTRIVGGCPTSSSLPRAAAPNAAVAASRSHAAKSASASACPTPTRRAR